jgi:hypothetical protein
MKFRQYDFYRCIKIIFSVVLFSFSSFAQTVNINIGQTQSTTSFRTSGWHKGGNHLLFTPKRGIAADLGVEYLVRGKTSLYSSFSFYQSGAKLEEYDVIRIMDPYTGSTGYISETMIRESLGIYFFYRPR